MNLLLIAFANSICSVAYITRYELGSAYDIDTIGTFNDQATNAAGA
jgi:hypothetical protein